MDIYYYCTAFYLFISEYSLQISLNLKHSIFLFFFFFTVRVIVSVIQKVVIY